MKIVFDTVSSVEAQEIATKIVSTEGAVVTVNEDKRSEKPKDKTFLNVFGSSFAPGHEVFGEKLWAKVGRLLEEKVIRVRSFVCWVVWRRADGFGRPTVLRSSLEV